MLYASWSVPFVGEMKTLRLKKDPFRFGLGLYEDVNGVTWHVYSLVGGKEPYVNARPVHLHPDYYGTHVGASNAGSHEWPPYRIEIVEAM